MEYARRSCQTSKRMNDRCARSADEFAEVVREFCEWCVGARQTDFEAASWLCRLYAAALVLPQVGPENEEGLPEIPSSELSRAEVGLVSFNGRYYWEVFDPDPSLSEKPCIGDLGDDLLDIYKDVRQGLLVFDRGDYIDAMWHWSFLHRVHWGRHAAAALLALHGLSVAKSE